MRLREVLVAIVLQGCAQGGVASPDAPATPPPDARVDAAVIPDAVPPPPDAQESSGCSFDGPREVFSSVMVGCPGTSSWADREFLCGAGYTTCSASWWVSLRGGGAPSHSYWTDDELRYSGSSTACSVHLDTGTPCTAGMPMRVCAATSPDPEGNRCNWTNCGYQTATPNEYFGGCLGNSTAGTLCCRAPCADGTTEDTFPGGMFGCAGSIPWSERDSLCGVGYHVCSAQEWVGGHGGLAPAHSYWIDDELDRDGELGACAAVSTGGTPCTAGRPMRICSAPTDPEGNTCSWTGCGFESVTPNRYFGGCDADATAGALCCVD
jgi:hypothetical protein